MTVGNVTADVENTPWNSSYEFKAVPLLAIGFGVVSLDRFIINPLFPVMRQELGLTYGNLGLISAVLALTWGLASIVTGRLSDRIGRKHVLVPAAFMFSLLVAVTGLATGLVSLLLIRGVMGLAEGAYAPASIVATVEASKPSRVGFNVGLQQMASPLVGLAIAPLLVVYLLKVLPSWHWVFTVAAVPGFLVAIAMIFVLRRDHPGPAAVAAPTFDWSALKYRNVVFAILGMCCCLTVGITLSAFMPNYLTDYLHLDTNAMAVVLTGQGFGSCIGMIAMPAVSDWFGRKAVILPALVIGLALLFVLQGAGAHPMLLFALLFGTTFVALGVMAITVGPLVSSSVPAAIATTATGLVVGFGEIIGGALAPALAGAASDVVGIAVIIKICIGAVIVALLVYAFGIQEPKRIAPLA